MKKGMDNSKIRLRDNFCFITKGCAIFLNLTKEIKEEIDNFIFLCYNNMRLLKAMGDFNDKQ